MGIKDFFSFRKNRFFWVNILLMILVVLVLIFGTLYVLDKYTRHGESVVVADVRGMSVTEAKQILKRNGLKAEVSDSTYVKELTPGRIMEQNPSDGMRVKKGRTIYLTINTLSVPLVAVPNVADNSSLRQAQAKLMAVGFRLTEEEYINGDKDWVYGVKYNGRELGADEKVPVGSTLTLMVGEGLYNMEDEPRRYDDQIIYVEESSNEPIVDDSWF